MYTQWIDAKHRYTVEVETKTKTAKQLNVVRDAHNTDAYRTRCL